MKAITVRQPWAWAILHGGKDVENRTRNIAGSYRGPLVIHAGLALDKAAMCAAWFEHTGQAITDHDRADALWCRQVGLHLMGAGEALALPPRQLAAAEGLRDQLPTTG